MTGTKISTTAFVEEKKLFSDTVKALLIYTKGTDNALNTSSAIECLAPLYHPDMKVKDVITVVLNALIEISKEPLFCAPPFDNITYQLLTAPINGTSCLGDMVCGPKITDEFAVGEFYNSIVNRMLNIIRFTNAGWCREYLFPETDIKQKELSNEQQS
jgi:hypothetical protein